MHESQRCLGSLANEGNILLVDFFSSVMILWNLQNQSNLKPITEKLNCADSVKQACVGMEISTCTELCFLHHFTVSRDRGPGFYPHWRLFLLNLFCSALRKPMSTTLPIWHILRKTQWKSWTCHDDSLANVWSRYKVLILMNSNLWPSSMQILDSQN